MATNFPLAEQSGETPESVPTYYTSNVLKLLTEDLEKRQDAQVLDMGPVCTENITFIAQRVKRLCVCDMFLRLDRHLRKGLPTERVWRHLDYPPRSFDGILLWELADRLDDRAARSLTDLCQTLIRPGGKVFVFVLGELGVSSVVNTFVIGEGFRVYLRPQPHLDLPFQGRKNRDVLSLMTPFKPVKSFIYRNGLREFLFQHE